MNWYVQAFQKYDEFDVRSRRNEYWYFVLINALLILSIIIIELVFGTYDTLDAISTKGVIVLTSAVTVQCVHDMGRNDWSILLGLIPVIRGMIRHIFLHQDNLQEENQKRPRPK
jgi:uncharacterized membrane protein YhaH (DUF805 family)